MAANPGLSKEIRNEEKLFLADVLRHLPDTIPDSFIIAYCDRLRAIYLQEGQDGAFLRNIADTIRDLETREDGARFRPLIGGWLASLPGMQPKTRDGSLTFTPDQLLWGDVGPTNIPGPPGDFWTGNKIKSPRRYALVAWPIGGSWHGRPPTAFIEARFKLVAPSDGSGLLRLEAQDAMLEGYSAEDRRSAMRLKMAVSVNGLEVFTGDAGFPRGDWGSREFPIPPGVLRKGPNVVRITNLSGFNFWSTTNWLCVSSLTVSVGSNKPRSLREDTMNKCIKFYKDFQ